MQAFKALPYRIQVLNSAFWLPVSQAVELVRYKKAREVHVNGEFIGIELGHFGQAPLILDKSPLPPAELPDTRFVLHRIKPLHSLIMERECHKDWAIACIGSMADVRSQSPHPTV